MTPLTQPSIDIQKAVILCVDHAKQLAGLMCGVVNTQLFQPHELSLYSTENLPGVFAEQRQRVPRDKTICARDLSKEWLSFVVQHADAYFLHALEVELKERFVVWEDLLQQAHDLNRGNRVMILPELKRFISDVKKAFDMIQTPELMQAVKQKTLEYQTMERYATQPHDRTPERSFVSSKKKTP